jgi:hypothetical protein
MYTSHAARGRRPFLKTAKGSEGLVKGKIILIQRNRIMAIAVLDVE